MNKTRLFAFAAFVCLAITASGQDRFTAEVEAGPAWQIRNDFAVPGDTGTLVRLDDRGPTLAARLTLTWKMSERWSFRAFAAPLSVESELTPERPIEFADATFAAGEPARVDYRFDSYRVSAIRNFNSDGRWSFRAGATLKLRDAEIAMRNGTTRASKENRGLVPLLHGGARVALSERVALDAEADAAAAPQGRALDAIVRIERRIASRNWIYAGARMLEGGADNDEVNTFATFVYLVGGVRVAW